MVPPVWDAVGYWPPPGLPPLLVPMLGCRTAAARPGGGSAPLYSSAAHGSSPPPLPLPCFPPSPAEAEARVSAEFLDSARSALGLK